VLVRVAASTFFDCKTALRSGQRRGLMLIALRVRRGTRRTVLVFSPYGKKEREMLLSCGGEKWQEADLSVDVVLMLS
jgi:hypothetical protein